MTQRNHDQLTLFEKVLYHEAFDGQDQDDGDPLSRSWGDGDRPNFERGDRVIDQCHKTGALISGTVWAVGNKFLRLNDDTAIKIDTASVIGQTETLDTALTNNSKTEHRWIETTYVVKGGKKFVPYCVERWSGGAMRMGNGDRAIWERLQV